MCGQAETASANRLSHSPQMLVESYKISVGDQLKVSVWKNPDISIEEPVRPDGKISVPLVGDIQAAGKDPKQLAAEVEAELSTFLREPRVTIVLTSLQGHEFLSRIRVTGAVEQNLSMPYHQGITVLDAILEAGSVTEFAAANRTKLYRRTGGVTETYDIRLEDIMKDGDMSTNVTLMPGDVITVPEGAF